MILCIATNNTHKTEEIKPLLPSYIRLQTLKEIGCQEELPETTGTISGNSLQKAQYIWDKYGISCFADDTGLEVEALGGAPGVDTAIYAGTHRSNEDNIDLLLQNLKGITQRKARFRTVISLVLEGKIHQFEGIAAGNITEARIGNGGFGYDPVFIPEGYNISFAQMTLEEKNKLSHRAKAVKLLVDFLKIIYV
jgi:XTP/dITP diphosphohydrolase